MPAMPLLAAKLYPPAARPHLVSRSRLTEKLVEGVRSGRRVSIVCAPAGFGKTTLVTDWLQAGSSWKPDEGNGPKQPFGWLSLEPADDDLHVFLSYLLGAIRSAHPEIGSTTKELLESGARLPYTALLPPLINDLFTLSEPFILVLDDYHAIQDPAIHEAVTFLLERQPPVMHTVITTRHDPLLPVSRWRARGQVTEIRMGELRFSTAECAEFLNRTVGLNLVESDIAALEARTEGWIAGLQMAAISIQQSRSEHSSESAEDFIRAFSGDDRFIMDYLVDEVISRQSPELQDFLLKTSILDRFNADLCSAVLTEDGDGGDIQSGQAAQKHIAYLEEANLFLVPLDNRRQWYRYHHLFAELLRHRLETSGGRTTASALRRRASRWCEQNQLPDQAIQYAQSAGDWELTCRLVIQYSVGLVRQGEILTLLRWFRAIPDTVIRQNPKLCQIYGNARSASGQLRTGKEYLALAQQGFSGNPEELGSTLVYLANNALFRGQFLEEIDLARLALELLPVENSWMRAAASLTLGMGLLHSGDPQGAERACQSALQTGRLANAARTCINALDQLGRIAVLGLDFARAEEYFKQAISYLSGEQPYPGADLPCFDLAMLKLEQNALDEVSAYVERGLEANARSGSIEMRAYGYRLAARLHQLRGNEDEAAQFLTKALQLASDFDLSPLTLSLNAALEVEMALMDGDVRRAEQAAPRVTNSLGVYPFIFFPETACAHLVLVRGRPADALEIIQGMLERVKQNGWEFPRLQIRVLQALAASKSQDAHALLKEALALAYPAGAVRTFLDPGEPMRVLLRSLDLRAESPALKTFVLSLLALFPVGQPEPLQAAPLATVEELVEPLSDREIEVLRLLAAGLSNLEIAQKLFLSPNTLKAHTQNIYSKLDVHSRVQAVNRARELKLI